MVAFGRLAEICSEYLRKGKPVFIEGRIKTRNWTDGNGAVHYRTEVIAEGMRMIGGETGNRYKRMVRLEPSDCRCPKTLLKIHRNEARRDDENELSHSQCVKMLNITKKARPGM